MNNVLRFIQFLALGTWVGSIIYFIAVVTRGAFAVLTRDEAGLLVGFTISGLHQLGIIAAVLFLIAALALEKTLAALIRPAAACVLIMLVLTLFSQHAVLPRIDALRHDMVSVDNTPPTDPRRTEFDRLHTISVDLESAVLLLGLAALFLSARTPRPNQN
jgi:Domain of unknown function (DUF4149)